VALVLLNGAPDRLTPTVWDPDDTGVTDRVAVPFVKVAEVGRVGAEPFGLDLSPETVTGCVPE
jgi:hypothetical protein